MKKQNLTKQKGIGGITLIALVITIIVLLILAGVSIAMLTGDNGILTQAQNAKTETQKGEEKEQIALAWLGAIAGNLDGSVTARDLNEQFETNGVEVTATDNGDGTIIVTYGDNVYTIDERGNIIGPSVVKLTVADTSGAIPPVLKDGMKAITFTSNGTPVQVSEENVSKNNWYSYEVQTGTTDTYNEETGEYGTSHWANAKLNGNYYVWIPRYAYKIDKSVSYTTQDGDTSYKIDVKFIEKDVTSSNVETEVGEGYIVHPAFTFDGNQKSGIWVGKYESSKDISGNVTIVPNATSYTNINVKTMFDSSKVLSTTNNDAHIIKNIEWGAVAYLAQSQYGRNGTEISVNQSSQMITGAGKAEGTNQIYETAPYETDPTTDQQYNGKIGKLSSTTGNIFGVYDMSGGATEYVMGFYGTAEDTPSLGSTGFTSEDKPDRKYYDLYINKTSSDSSNIGDALYETEWWNGDWTYFLNDEYGYPVFTRGGYYEDSSYGGIFNYSANTGEAAGTSGFRVCITVNE